MRKIYYNVDGWVCERYPNDFEIDDKNRYIEVTDEQYQETLGSDLNHAWRVVDGVLSHERYQEDSSEESEYFIQIKRKEKFFQVFDDLELIEARMIEVQFDLTFSFAGGNIPTLTAKKDEYRRLYVKRAELSEIVKDDVKITKTSKRLEELIPGYVRC